MSGRGFLQLLSEDMKKSISGNTRLSKVLQIAPYFWRKSIKINLYKKVLNMLIFEILRDIKKVSK